MEQPQLIQGGIIFTVINLILQILWSQRDRLGTILQRRVNSATTRKEAEAILEQRAWERLLDNGKWGKGLVNRLFLQADQSLNIVVDMARNTEAVAGQSIEVMKDFGSLARALVDRLDRMDKTNQALNQTLAGIGFVLARLYFQDDRQSFDDLVAQMYDEIGASNDA